MPCPDMMMDALATRPETETMRQLTYAASLAGLTILTVFLMAASLFERGPFDPPRSYLPGDPMRVAGEPPGR